ncbi:MULTISPECIES: acyl-CoA thioesterase [unclassified Siphonobacter]|uniref:acyl-CoA thioesterase n=1 Tax=unclassified Siphonobacter TaxID=2635712 RepID=UPI000CA795D3|nr:MULTISPECIES: acyl-CoA thioesterase [unclassified Siphonobacter]MDQ1088675.1 acyl-CoA hydrolase [Siphonobacter sp. SORGH_AS_1065]MDR6194822.1 acyl-CoA hydrolase [Siphonobacter sp. SORGH_AS_0500]PKK35060.1 acyl-CoA thioesterase [Siphonobacter sp. SORGH_AS_0500]
MSLEEKIKAAETRVFKAVFPHTTNHYDTLYGGMAMQWMDEIAFITATRLSRKPMVTVSSDRIDFRQAIQAGMLVELIGNVVHVGNTSMRVSVEIYVESMYAEGRELAIHGTFTFVAIDANKKPIRILE